MDKWIKENKIGTGIIIILFFILLFFNLNKPSKKMQSNSIPDKTTLEQQIAPSKTLHQDEKMAEELCLFSNGKDTQQNAEELILFAIKYPTWVKSKAAIGMAGANLLDADILDQIGYRSLFFSPYIFRGFKMYASQLMDDLPLIRGKSPNTFIAQREGAIYEISNLLNSRYIYNKGGNYGRNYLPEPGRKSNIELKNAVIKGIKIYTKFLNMGYRDDTLGAALGIAIASLENDGVTTHDIEGIYSLTQPQQIYADALKATLEKLNKNKNHSEDFLEALGWEMESRGLDKSEGMLGCCIGNEKSCVSLLKIIEMDFEIITKKRMQK